MDPCTFHSLGFLTFCKNRHLYDYCDCIFIEILHIPDLFIHEIEWYKLRYKEVSALPKDVKRVQTRSDISSLEIIWRGSLESRGIEVCLLGGMNTISTAGQLKIWMKQLVGRF